MGSTQKEVPTPLVIYGFVLRFMDGLAFLDITLPDGSVLECDIPEELAKSQGLREQRRFKVFVKVEDIPDKPLSEEKEKEIHHQVEELLGDSMEDDYYGL